MHYTQEQEMTCDSTALDTDLYHVDAAYIAWKTGQNGLATFDLFTRRNPFAGGFMLAAGLELAAEYINGFRYTQDDLDWFSQTKGYDADFLDMLGNLRFTGDVIAMPEGEIVFPHEPMLRIDAPFVEAMLLESGLLRTLGISTLIATKAARIHNVAQGRGFADFAFRRAHEPMWATRSAYIGGADSTSYVSAAKELHLPGSGTIPHAIVQAFADEESAFREIAALMPRYTLLIDTYDVEQGIINAISAAKAEAATGSGHELLAVRIDSGDLAEWAKLVKRYLVEADMPQVKILVSGDIDEYRVQELLATGAPIDGFGVGGNLGVGLGTVESGTVGGVIGAVYKLSWMAGTEGPDARMKIAGSKSTWPGRKLVYRVGDFDHDVIALDDEPAPKGARPLLQPWMKNGEIIRSHPTLDEIRERSISNLAMLPDWLQELSPAREYDVRYSDAITALREQVMAAHAPHS